MAHPDLGLSLCKGPRPQHPWLWRALTADLGTAAAVGGRPLLLELTASVSVCSILRGPGKERKHPCLPPQSRPNTLSAPSDPARHPHRRPLPSGVLRPLRSRPARSAPGSHLVVVGTEVFEVSEADVAETDDDGDDQDNEGEHRRGGQEPWGRGTKEGAATRPVPRAHSLRLLLS